MSHTLSTIDIVIIIAYLAVVISLGMWMKRRAAKNIGSSSYSDITGIRIRRTQNTFH